MHSILHAVYLEYIFCRVHFEAKCGLPCDAGHGVTAQGFATRCPSASRGPRGPAAAPEPASARDAAVPDRGGGRVAARVAQGARRGHPRLDRVQLTVELFCRGA